MAPRVIIANSNLVGKWANWEHFNELDRKGLMMYGQMTAGSWIISHAGDFAGDVSDFCFACRPAFRRVVERKLVVTGGVVEWRRAALVRDAERWSRAGRRRGPHAH